MEKIKIVVLHSSEGVYAQCLDYDIAAQGKTEEMALERLHMTINAEIAACAEKGVSLSSLGPAPAEMQSLFGVTSISSNEIELKVA